MDTITLTTKEHDELNNRPEHLPGEISEIGWRPPEDDIPFTDWLKYKKGLDGVYSSWHFINGDVINYGERAYGEKYAAALPEFSYGTHRNDAWVCRTIPIDYRVIGCSWTHHQITAGFTDVPAVAKYVLEKARDRGWTTRRLAAILKRWGFIFGGKSAPVRRFPTRTSSYLPLATTTPEAEPTTQPEMSDNGTGTDYFDDAGLPRWRNLTKRYFRFYKGWQSRAIKAEQMLSESEAEVKQLTNLNIQLQQDLAKALAPDVMSSDWKAGVEYEG